MAPPYNAYKNSSSSSSNNHPYDSYVAFDIQEKRKIQYIASEQKW